VGAGRLSDTEVRYVDADGMHVDTSVAAVDAARLMTALPVRRIRSRAGQRHRPGLFWSATTRGHVPYESRLELDRLWLADFDPAVSWIAAQPMLLSGRDRDRLRRHVPDLLLTRTGLKPLVVDVKPAVFAARPEVAEVFAWTSRVCSAAGWDYEVWTGGDPIVLANVRSLSVVRRFVNGTPPGSVCMDRWSAMARAWDGSCPVDLSSPLTAAALQKASP